MSFHGDRGDVSRLDINMLHPAIDSGFPFWRSVGHGERLKNPIPGQHANLGNRIGKQLTHSCGSSLFQCLVLLLLALSIAARLHGTVGLHLHWALAVPKGNQRITVLGTFVVSLVLFIV